MTDEEKKEKKRAYRRKHYEAHREKYLAVEKARYAAQSEEIKARTSAYYAANREKIAARGKKYREKHRETRKAKNKEYYERRGGRRKSLYANLLWRYDLTPEKYDALIVASCGRCDSCGRVDDGSMSRGLVVDHDHATRRVRGVLCGACNKALGLLGESQERVAALASYIRREVIVEDWSI